MSKRRKSSGAVKAVTNSNQVTKIAVEDLPFSDQLIMTERGFEKAGNPLSVAQTGGVVHAPQFMNLSGQTLPPKRGTRELQKLYSESPWLRAIVSKIARAVAGTDWVMYAKKNAQGKYVTSPDIVSTKNGKLRVERLHKYIDVNQVDAIYSHPLLTMLENGTGNPRLNGFSAMEVTEKHIDLIGEAFWLIEPDELGTPVAFWPLPPSWIQDFPNTNNPNYVISAPRGLTVSVPASMIIPFIDPDPDDPYGRGSGIAKSLDDEIQIDEYAAKHSRSFFLNRARPDIIVSGQFINQKDAERLEKQWLSDHQGFWKAFKPLFFSQKIDVKELSHNFEQLQMVQLRKHERDTFVNVFGIPPEKIGLIGESKRSTIQAADMFWNKDVIKPRVEMIRRVLQQALVPRFDERLILYYETPVIQEDEFKLAAMKLAPFASTINEWRKVQGHPSLGPAGDVLVIPLNNQIVATKEGVELYPVVVGGVEENKDSKNQDNATDNEDETDDNVDEELNDSEDGSNDDKKEDDEKDLTKSMYDREGAPKKDDTPRKKIIRDIADMVLKDVEESLERLIPQNLY